MRQANRGEVALENTIRYPRNVGPQLDLCAQRQLRGYRQLDTGTLRPIGQTDTNRVFLLLHKLTERYPVGLRAGLRYFASLRRWRMS